MYFKRRAVGMQTRIHSKLSVTGFKQANQPMQSLKGLILNFTEYKRVLRKMGYYKRKHTKKWEINR